MLRNVSGEVRAAHAPGQEAPVPAEAGEMLARQFDALPRRGLERLLALVDPIAPELFDRGEGAARWFERDGWRVFAPPAAPTSEAGAALASFEVAGGRKATLSWDPISNHVHAPFDLFAAYDAYVTEAWVAATRGRSLSPRLLNAFYRVKRFIPRPLQLRARRLVIRWQGLPEFPGWPFDRSVAHLLRFYAFAVLRAQSRSEAPFRWFWPDGHRAALVLTHDVEREDGLRLALELADFEEERGFRSSFNLGAWYRVDPGFVRELTSRGFEVGAHGLRHDRSLFASRASFDAQQPALRDLMERLGATSFRSPATHRVVDWIGELPFECDSSIPHSDPFEPQPGGSCTLWPFFIGRVVELPYTLPQDHTLFTLLGHRTSKLWLEQAQRIESEHGMIVSLTHPDRGYLGDPEKRSLYGEFLDAMAERPGLWRALPREVAGWWRSRDNGRGEHGLVRIGESPDEVALEPPPGPS
jgi:peptidoglycan/xylan/chitin deacetylase (PgdA/CDA1 family)